MAVTLWPRRRSSSAAAAPNRPSPMTSTSSSWALLRAIVLPSLTRCRGAPACHDGVRRVACRHGRRHERRLGRGVHGLRLRPDAPDGTGPTRPHDPAGRGRSACSTTSTLLVPEVADDDVLRDRPRPRLHRGRAPRLRPTPRSPTSTGASAPTTTRPSPACTRPRPASPRAPSTSAAGCGRATSSTASTTAAACTTRCAPTRAGFCIYNDVGVGIQWLLDHGAERVAYVDIDVHHGDGVERMFWNDPRVLTISVHESGRHLFPGTGWPADIGGPVRAWHGRQRRAAAGHGRLRVAALDRVGRAAAGAGLRPRRARQPARLRHPHARPAGPPGHHRRRPAPRPRDAARPGARDGIGPVGGARRRRLRARRGRAAVVDPPDRHRRARAGAGRHGRAAGVARPRAAGPRAWRARPDGRPARRPRCRSGCSRGTWGTTPTTPVDRAVLATRQAIFPLHGLDPWFD